MAERKSVMLYLDAGEQWDMLSDDQAGKLIKALLRYGRTGERLETKDGMLSMAFSFMAAQIDRDGEKYDMKCERNRKIALEREEKKRAERERNSTNVHERAQTFTKSTDTDKDTDKDKDTDTVTDTDKDTDTDIINNNKNNSYSECVKAHSQPCEFVKPSLEQVKAYCMERGNKVNYRRFFDYYESNGWKVGKNQMIDWKATVRSWESNGYKNDTSATDVEPYKQVINKFLY